MAKIGVEVVDLDTNPTISKDGDIAISFYQTRESLYDSETYRSFIKDAMRRFRRSVTYTSYKHELIELGLDRCALQSNLDFEHCTIEMHHTILNLMDIAILLCEHTLNTKGKISTFDLVNLLKQEHLNNRIAVVMLTVTNHQLYHHSDKMFIHPDMIYGKWYELLQEYRTGITPAIANKLIGYINKCIYEGHSTDGDLLKLRDDVYNWAQY